MADTDNAPDVSSAMPQPDTSALGSIMGSGPSPTPVLNESGDPNNNFPTGGVGSRLAKVLSAVAGVVGPGIAGAAQQRGRPSFAGGMVGGANDELEYQFKTADDAVRAAQLTRQDRELDLRRQEAKDVHDNHVLSMVKANQDLGIDYDVLPNDQDAVKQYMKASTGAGGIQVPPGVLVTSANIYVPKQGQKVEDAQTEQFKELAPAYGVPVQLGKDGKPDPKLQQALINRMFGYSIEGVPYGQDKLPQQISIAEQNLANAKELGLKPSAIARLTDTLANLRGQLKSATDNETSQKAADEQAVLAIRDNPDNVAAEANAAGKKAAAEAKAKLPYELAKGKADEALKDGDPNSAAQLLVNGDIAPSQIISSRKPAFAQQAFDAAKKLNPQWNAQAAEGYYKAAGSSQNVTFFGSAKSLTDQNGTLDQLQQAYNRLPNGQIPRLNKVADWTSAAAGGGATAGFAQTALGVADDYAKVMGGGQGSDTAREEVLQSFARSHSPEQMASAISAARLAVDSQMASRIGSNPVMRKMYGEGLLVRVNDPQGGLHTFRTQEQADAFKKAAGIQ